MKRIILGADRGDGLIGLWWYTDDCNVIGLSEPVDNGVLDGDYIQFSEGNHMTRWRDVIESFLPDNASNIISKGFKSMYRGRVCYDTRTACFVITCSEDIVKNIDFRNAVLEYFQLTECNRRFEALEHYHHKNELTGNPAVDSLYLD